VRLSAPNDLRDLAVISPASLGDGRCAGGRILTVFSAPDYGGHHKNDAAMVVMSRELHVFPKVLHARGRAALPLVHASAH